MFFGVGFSDVWENPWLEMSTYVLASRRNPLKDDPTQALSPTAMRELISRCTLFEETMEGGLLVPFGMVFWW